MSFLVGQTQSGATRTQLLKGGAAAAALLGKGGTVTRAIVTEKEMADLIKRQQIMQQQQKNAAAANAAANAAAAAAANSAASTSGQQTTPVQISGAPNPSGLTAAQFIAQGGIQVSLLIFFLVIEGKLDNLSCFYFLGSNSTDNRRSATSGHSGQDCVDTR